VFRKTIPFTVLRYRKKLEQAGIYGKSILAYYEVAYLDAKRPQPYFYISFCYQLLSNKTEAEKFVEKAFQKMNTGIRIW